MLLTNEINIKVNNRYLRKYSELGYGKLKQGDYIVLPIKHVPLNSSVIIEYICDYCNKKYELEYRKYTMKIGNDCCLTCRPIKHKESCLEKYGVDNISKLPETHNKIKKTNIKKYGSESYTQTDKFKRDHKNKMLKKYGVSSFSKTSEWLEKQKRTSLVRYGVENVSQCPQIFSKQQKSRYEIFEYKDTNLYYQGSYELDFLDKYYDKYEISSPDSIEYIFENKNKKYFPDFYISKYNLIVEIKSSYTYEKYLKQNLAKQRKCLDMGYNFIFIIDKDYKEFNILF